MCSPLAFMVEKALDVVKVVANTLQLVEKGCSGLVSLDHSGGRSWILVHSLTFERVQVTADFGELIEDEVTGEVVLLTVQGDADPVLSSVATLFTTTLYENSATGELFVHQTGPDDKAITLDTFRSRYRAASCGVSLTNGSSSSTMQAFVFRVPRVPKQSIFWSMNSLYLLLGMKTFRGVPSKWAWNVGKRWEPVFVKSLGVSQMCFGTYLTEASTEKEKLHASSRCLPTSSVSTVGLLIMLVSWSFLCAQRGGVTDVCVRQHSQELFARFLQTGTSSAGSSCLNVMVEEQWVPRWPRAPGLPGSHNSCRLCFGADGRACVQELLDFVRANPQVRPHNSWAAKLRPLVDEGGHCEIYKLIQALAHIKEFDNFVLQMLWHISLEVEKVFGLMTNGKCSNGPGALTLHLLFSLCKSRWLNCMYWLVVGVVGYWCCWLLVVLVVGW